VSFFFLKKAKIEYIITIKMSISTTRSV